MIQRRGECLGCHCTTLLNYRGWCDGCFERSQNEARWGAFVRGVDSELPPAPRKSWWFFRLFVHVIRLVMGAAE